MHHAEYQDETTHRYMHIFYTLILFFFHVDRIIVVFLVGSRMQNERKR